MEHYQPMIDNEMIYAETGEYCDECHSVHTNHDIYGGDYVFECQLVQAGFTEIESYIEEINDYVVERDGLVEILAGPDGQLHEFHRRGNGWYSYSAPYPTH